MHTIEINIMPMYCAICKHNPETIPCEYCGNSYLAFQMSPHPTDEELDSLYHLLQTGYHTSQLVGVTCAICGQPFTFAFFNAGGKFIRTDDNEWQHDYCSRVSEPHG